METVEARVLRERHSLTHKTPKYKVKAGDVVIMKTDDKNRGKWPLAIVEWLFPGPDCVTRAVQLKTKKRRAGKTCATSIPP